MNPTRIKRMALVLALLFVAVSKAEVSSPSVNGEYYLSDYGQVKTAGQAEATLQRAGADILKRGGGILIVGPMVAVDWGLENNLPSSTKQGSPAVTILDRRSGYEQVLLPANGKMHSTTWSGKHITRTLRKPIDMAMGVHSTEAIDTYIVGGTTSYMQYCLFALKAGKDQRVYVPIIRGLAAGLRILISGSPRGYAQPFDRPVIKSLGWDKKLQKHYFVADLKHDHPAEAMVYDKHVVNSMTITDHSNSDNQSMALLVNRYNYGQGDSFGISSHLTSMSNIMSSAGDEGGLAYSADISNDLNPFHSTVESVDWKKQELVYAAGSVRNHTLGTSRPLINLNTKKWVTAGTVFMVAPGYQDPWDTANKDETGKIFQKKALAGGAIIGSKDCGWTSDIVGRFFAVNEPTEYLDPANDPGAGYTHAPTMRLYRWYMIQKLEDRPDGTKRIYVERTRWWSRIDVVPTLYRFNNYTWEGHEKALKYIIAPGSYVADISRAWTDSYASGGWISKKNTTRTLKLAPTGDVGTSFDFEKGDPITQAIGQDPWNPTGMRIRHHNYLPTTIEDASFQSVNVGRVAVDTAFSITGSYTNINDAEKQKDGKSMYLKGIDIGATTKVGIQFRADVKDAALWFKQPHNRAQPIWWSTTGGLNTLTVDPATRNFILRGGPTRLGGVILEKGGISAGDKPALNLRGIAVAMMQGSTELEVVFQHREADDAYAVSVTPNWITAFAVTEKSGAGFTVQFEKRAPAKSTFDWMIVR